MNDYDIIIVGGGMAGASLGAEVAAHARVLILEMEDVAGYHATGRSVAFWTESYGGPKVQPLTSASGPLLSNPDPDFSESGFLTRRGAIHVGCVEDRHLGDEMISRFFGSGVSLTELDGADLARQIPGLRPNWTIGISEPTTADIDVAALHAAFLRQVARHGGILQSRVKLISAQHDRQGWCLRTSLGDLRCAILVNAAGAWADDVARACNLAPIGIKPLRRTVVQLRVDPEVTDDLPLVLDLSARFYFKPAGAGRIWLSPHDEEPSTPCDAAPEEVAVATAIDRLHEIVDWQVEAVERKWAGLRSFAADRLPVYGYDPKGRDFFWFAGQGGFGIQTSPAAAKIAAALLLKMPVDPGMSNIDAGSFSPMRFGTRPL